MILDSQLIYSDAQAITSVGNTDSTNIIDQLSAGDAYESMFITIQVETAFTSAGAGTLAVNLLIDSDVAFGTATTVPLVAATALANLTDGKVLFKGRVPFGMKRYRKLQYVVGTAAMTGGKIDAMEVTDVQTNR